MLLNGFDTKLSFPYAASMVQVILLHVVSSEFDMRLCLEMDKG